MILPYKGDGINAYNLEPKPRGFTDSTFLIKADSAYVVKAITGGGLAVDLSAMMPLMAEPLPQQK